MNQTENQPKPRLELRAQMATIEEFQKAVSIRPKGEFFVDSLAFSVSISGELQLTSKDGLTVPVESEGMTVRVPVNFFSTDNGVMCEAGGKPWEFDIRQLIEEDGGNWEEWRAAFDAQNRELGLEAPSKLAVKSNRIINVPNGYQRPEKPKLPAFLEARETATSISNGRDLKCWSQLEGIEAMLHQSPVKTANFQIRLLPSAAFQQWHGAAGVDVLTRELQSCDFDSVLLFYVCLSWALESPGMRVVTSLDALISAIGQDENARQGERETLRAKVWRDLLIFDSLEVIGARPGHWREPGASGEKREKMGGDKLHSSDALLRILGHRHTADEVPKEVSLIVGDWAAKFQGNREFLSEFGNLRLIATIPARQAAGAWARCIGLNLNQYWREKSAKAIPITHKNDAGEVRSQTLKFPAITRRELIFSTLRPNHDVESILNGNDPQRAKTYWNKAVKILQDAGIIGYYKELKPIPMTRWKADWLEQPLDIRPKGDALSDALEINVAAAKARKRKPVSRKK